MVSQILSSVLDGKPLVWFWSKPGEMLWIWGWALVGGILAWRVRNPFWLGGAIVGGSVGVFVVCFEIF